jgi:hypothetical protein
MTKAKRIIIGVVLALSALGAATPAATPAAAASAAAQPAVPYTLYHT